MDFGLGQVLFDFFPLVAIATMGIRTLGYILGPGIFSDFFN